MTDLAVNGVAGDSSLLTRFVSALLIAFVVATVSVPTAIWNKLIFGLIMAFAILRFAARPESTRIPTWSPAVILAVFSYGMLLSLSGDANLDLARQFLFSVAVLLLIYPVLWFDLDMDRAIKIGGVTIALLTGGLLASVLLASSSGLAAAAVEFFLQYSLSRAGDRDFLEAPIFMVRLGSAPFLFLPFVLFVADIRKRPRLWDVVGLVLVTGAIIASTSRGLIVVCLAATLLLLLESSSNLGRAFWTALTIPLLVGAVALASTTAVVSMAEYSNAIKLGHAASFADRVTAGNAVFGEGLASYYYSEGLGRRTAETEITLLDHLRYFGFLLTPIVWLALIFPTMRLSTYISDPSRIMSAAVFLLYLTMSFTNPVLFNSFGLTVVVWYWWRLLRDSPHDLRAE